MGTDQLLIQLGISGAVLFVGWQIAKVLIKAWRESEEQRLDVYAKAESERTSAIADGFRSINESHRVIVAGVSRLEGMARRTPGRGVPVLVGDE